MGLYTFVKRALGGPVKMPVQEYPREIAAGDVYGMQRETCYQLEKIMSALTDLQAAVAAAVAEIQKLAAAIAPVTVTGTSDADLAAQTAALNAAVAAAQPAPAPAAAEPAAPPVA